MGFLIVHMNDQFQEVSEIRANDIFTGMSVSFVFSTLLATTLVRFFEARRNCNQTWSEINID